MADLYKIQYSHLWDWTIEVEIDNNHLESKEAIKEMVEFWTGWEHELAMSDGNYTEVFLKRLAQQSLIDVVRNNHNIKGVISFFEDAEGWSPMDGSKGIKIVKVDPFYFDLFDFEVKRKEEVDA